MRLTQDQGDFKLSQENDLADMFLHRYYGTTTLSIMTLSITTLSTMPLSIMPHN